MKLRLLMLLSLGMGFVARAQYVTLGASNNYMSQGFTLGRQFKLSNSFNAQVGLYGMFNIHQWRVNKENYYYYKNGYAFNFWQHWGLQTGISWRLFQIHHFSTHINSNFLVTTYGLRIKSNHVPTLTDTGWTHTSYVDRFKGDIAIESSLGLKLAYQLTPRSQISGSVGVGCVIGNHSHIGYDETYDLEVEYNTISTNYEGWRRGFLDITGLDGWPTVNLTYGIKLFQPKRASQKLVAD